MLVAFQIIMMKYIAGIDIGTNSVLYSLFEIKGSKIARDLYFERHSPRIGSKLAGNDRPLITDISYINLKKIIEKNIRHALKAGAEKVLIAATNPFRLAKNGGEVKKRLENELGCKIAILSPDREAYLSFLAAAGHLGKDQTAVVIDMGGGSTELVAYRGEKRLAFISLPEGAVSLTEKFQSQHKVDPDNFEDYENYLSGYAKQVATILPYIDSPVKLVGGTSTALAWLKDSDILSKPSGITLTGKDIKRSVALLAPLTLTRRRQLLGIDKNRAEIIFAGAFWYVYLFKILGIKRAVATPRGLRHGLVMDFLGRQVFTA